MRFTTLKTRKFTLSLFAIVALAAQPAEAATFHHLGGIKDNYALPTSPAFPSAGLQTFLGANSFKPYDSTAIDQWFAETFTNCPMCITGATLEIGLKPLTTTGGGANNDSIRFGFTDNFGNSTGPYWGKNIGLPAGQQSVLPLNWGTQNYPNGIVLNLNLAALPLGNINTNGSTPNLVPALRQMKFLDVMIQDDTAVDYIDIKVVTALAGDMNGDGCVDAQDLLLLTSYFNQVTPAGVGDPDGNGVIDINDLGIVQADFGKCCPEPTSLALLAIGLCGLARRTRRSPRRTEQEWLKPSHGRSAARAASAGAIAMLCALTHSPASAQDYNSNAFVDAADFTVWRDDLGTFGPLANETATPGIVDIADYNVWTSSFVVPALSPSQLGGPSLVVTYSGPNIFGNLVWHVSVVPDATLFTNSGPSGTPPNTVGGSVAAEIGFEVMGTSLVSASKNATNFPFDNPGDSPFLFGDPPAAGVTISGNQIFAALGSDFLVSGTAHEMLIIETLGSAKTKLLWSGVYGPNGDQGRLAQAGINFDTGGMAMSVVPEPASIVLAIGSIGLATYGRGRRRDRKRDHSMAVRGDFRRPGQVIVVAMIALFVLATTSPSSTAAQYVFAPIALSGQQAPGVPGAVFGDFAFNVRPTLANNGDVAFEGILINGSSNVVTATNNSGVWAGGGANSLALVAREDDLAPGGGPSERYDFFDFPNISNVGSVAFSGGFRGPGITSANNAAIWGGPVGSLSLAARAGAQAPGAPAGHVFTNVIRAPYYSDAGHVSFRASVDVPNSNSDRDGMWVGPANNVQKVVIVGDPAPSLGTGVVYAGVETFSVPVNDAGQIVFGGDGFLGGVTSANDDGLFISPAGGPHTLALREGSPTGISQVNFTATNGQVTSINGSGEIITVTNLTGPGASPATNRALWAGPAGTLGLVARRGSQAADSLPGSLYDGFTVFSGGLEQVINDARDIAFLATLQGTETGIGLWAGNLANNPNALDRIAFAGEQAAGFPSGVNYDSLLGADSGVAINSLGSVLFTGDVTGTPGLFNRAVWLYEKTWNKVELVVRTGQQFQVAPNDIRTVADVSIWGGFGQNDGRWESLNDQDQLAFRLRFTDNTSGIFVASKMIVPEPTSWALGVIGTLTLVGLRLRPRTGSCLRAAAMLLGIALSLGGSSAQAQFSAGPIGPGLSIIVPETGSPSPTTSQFDFGSPANPLSVDFDLTAGPLRKKLNFIGDRDADGDVDMSDVNLILAAVPTGTLHEHFVVGPNGPPWTDWHEQMLLPDWVWSGTPQLMATDPAGLPVPLNLQTTVLGGTLQFDFNPLPPGTRVDIWKDFAFAPPVIDPTVINNVLTELTNGFFGPFVAEYPSVPEPASLALVPFAIVAGCLYHRRPRSTRHQV